MDLDDALELQVSEEELDATFPPVPTPPNSPVNETKLPFLDKLNFIIPRLINNINNIDNSTGKKCTKHHTVLCRVCNLVKRAHSVQRNKLKSLRIHTDDRSISAGDPNNYADDLPIDGHDPFMPTPPLEERNQLALVQSANSSANRVQKNTPIATSPLPQLFDKSLELNPVKGIEQKASAKKRRRNKRKATEKPSKCPSCGGCTCPRGTFKPKETGGKRGPQTTPPPTVVRPPSLLNIPVHRPTPPPSIPNLLDLPIVIPPRYRK